MKRRLPPMTCAGSCPDCDCVTPEAPVRSTTTGPTLKSSIMPPCADLAPLMRDKASTSSSCDRICRQSTEEWKCIRDGSQLAAGRQISLYPLATGGAKGSRVYRHLPPVAIKTAQPISSETVISDAGQVNRSVIAGIANTVATIKATASSVLMLNCGHRVGGRSMHRILAPPRPS